MAKTIYHQTMGFEGDIYVGPAGSTSHTASGMVLAKHIKDPKLSFGYSEVDATLRKHRGNKAYQKGMMDLGISFSLPNVKDESGEYPEDARIIMQSMRSRRDPITIIMIDKDGGEGPIGDFEVFGGEKSEESENAQMIEIECKPSAASNRPVRWYNNGTVENLDPKDTSTIN